MQERAKSSLENSWDGSWWSDLRPRLALRAACQEDESFFFSIFCSIREPDFAFLGELERKNLLKLQFVAQQGHYQVNMPEAEHLIVLQDGGPIGRMTFVLRNDELHLAEIALLPDHRNHGIGSILMKRLIKAEAEQGHSIRLHVYKQSAAVRFYERLGFAIAKDDGAYLLMEKLPTIQGDFDGGKISKI
ncbi:MAG: GNAT family N-acetyltransferase [Methanothrix sp.]|nr:GNAT family N-acetyltransferase [Methanothrix sp.]MDD4447836.1 GNAT family N-acetyltransferase [Methanothrix sp.]